MLNRRIGISLIGLFVLVLFLFFAVPISIADAVVPAKYVNDVEKGHNDWYFDSEYLDLERLQTTVSSWFTETDIYDFTSLEENPIIVAVIDTGINFTHEIFEGKYDANGNPVTQEKGTYDVLLRDEDGYVVGWNTYSNNSNILDDGPDQHGTHTAGIIATLIHKLDLEKYIKIMPIKASYPNEKESSSSFPVESVQRALNFALDNGATVVSMSLAGTGTKYRTMVTYAMSEQATFVAAAGNERTNSSSTPYYPAACTHVIGVMNASHEKGEYKFASSSNYGDLYDLIAPGTSYYSADGETENGYKALTGTSMSCPVVAFGAALAQFKYKGIYNKTGVETTIKDITEIVRGSAVKTVKKNNDYSAPLFDMNALAEEVNRAFCTVTIATKNLKQEIDNLSQVECYMTVIPKSYVQEGTISWSAKIDGKEINSGYGATFSFYPTKKVGIIEITGTLKYADVEMSDTKTVEITYAPFSYSRAKVKEKAEGETYGDKYVGGSTFTYSISGLNYVNPETIAKIMWYVDGNYVSKNGAEFTFEANESGTHVISAKLNQITIDSFEINIITDEEIIEIHNNEKKHKATIIGASVGAAVGALVIASIIADLVLRRKRK